MKKQIQKKWTIPCFVVLAFLGNSMTFGQAVDKPVKEESASQQEDRPKSLFGNFPKRGESGGGIIVFYGLSQFNKTDNGIPRIIGGHGFSQFGPFIRIGGFSFLGSGMFSGDTTQSMVLFGGPYLQLTLHLDPVILTLGTHFGLGINFSHPEQMDFLLYPQIGIELRLFENIACSVGVGFMRTRTSLSWPDLSQYNITFGINFMKFSTGKKEIGTEGLPELPKL